MSAGNIQLISNFGLFHIVQITDLNGLMFHVECAGSHESVRLKLTITKQVVLASPTTRSGKNMKTRQQKMTEKKCSFVSNLG